MNRWMILCAVALAACSGKNSDNTSEDTGVADMAVTQDQGGNNNPLVDMSQLVDTSNNVPGDMGSDTAAADASQDMAADMPTFPDVMEQNCAHPTTDPTCPMGEFGAGTFLNYIEIIEDATCCRDLTGDGVMDNKIGSYVQIINGTGEDVNANIDAAVQAGALAYVLEYANWGNEMFDPDLDFRVYLGVDDDIDFTDNLAGTGSFNVLPESFQMNGDPKWDFQEVTVNNGHLVATGGTLELFFPNLLDEVQMLVTDVRIEADVIPPADLASGGGVALENGEISGALARNLFYDSMNEASSACVCLGKNVFVYDAADDDYQCDIDMADEAACQFDPSSGCRFLSNRQTCQFLQLASGDIDVDADGDGTLDSFSVGVRFSGVPTEVVGRQ